MTQHRQLHWSGHMQLFLMRKRTVLKMRFRAQRMKCFSQLLYQVRQQTYHSQKATECNKARIGVWFLHPVQFPNPKSRGMQITIADSCLQAGGFVTAAMTEGAASVTAPSSALCSSWRRQGCFLLCSCSFFQLL